MSGIHAVLAGSSKPDVTAVPFTRGTSGPNEGVANTTFFAFGSFTGNTTLAGGRTIRGYYDGTTITEFVVLGNQTGTWWTSVTVNGTTYNRADATNPTGVFDSSETYWSWNTATTTWPSSGEIYVI